MYIPGHKSVIQHFMPAYLSMAWVMGGIYMTLGASSAMRDEPLAEVADIASSMDNVTTQLVVNGQPELTANVSKWLVEMLFEFEPLWMGALRWGYQHPEIGGYLGQGLAFTGMGLFALSQVRYSWMLMRRAQ